MLFQTLPSIPEEENGRLRKLLAKAMLDKEALKVDLGRKF
jgi:putative transposase